MKTVIIKTIYGVGVKYWLDGKEITKELAESFISHGVVKVEKREKTPIA